MGRSDAKLTIIEKSVLHVGRDGFTVKINEVAWVPDVGVHSSTTASFASHKKTFKVRTISRFTTMSKIAEAWCGTVLVKEVRLIYLSFRQLMSGYIPTIWNLAWFAERSYE